MPRHEIDDVDLLLNHAEAQISFAGPDADPLQKAIAYSLLALGRLLRRQDSERTEGSE